MRICTKSALVSVIFLYFILCWNVTQIFAQPRGGGPPGGGPPSSGLAGRPGFGPEMPMEAKFDDRPFDVTRQRLPPMFLGNNIQVIFKVMKKRKQGTDRKPEETGQGKGSPSTGVSGLGGTYAFGIAATENFYDTSEKILKMFYPLSSVLVNGREDEKRRGLRIEYIPQMDNHVSFIDANGKQIDIEEVKFRDYTVAFENFDQFPVEKTALPSALQVVERKRKKEDATKPLKEAPVQEMIVGKLNLQSQVAQKLRENVKLLAICTLAAPYVNSEEIHRMGTPEKPGEYLARHEYLYISLVELWFYDFVTGRVLMKIKPVHSG